MKECAIKKVVHAAVFEGPDMFAKFSRVSEACVSE